MTSRYRNVVMENYVDSEYRDDTSNMVSNDWRKRPGNIVGELGAGK